MTAPRKAIPTQGTVDCRTPFQHVCFRQSPIPTHPRTSHAMPATIVQMQSPWRHVFQVHDQRPRRTIGRAMHGNMTPFRHEPNNHDPHAPGKNSNPRGINHRNPETSQRGSDTYKYKASDVYKRQVQRIRDLILEEGTSRFPFFPAARLSHAPK